MIYHYMLSQSELLPDTLLKKQGIAVVYPLDLPSLNVCIMHGLNYRISEAFYRQDYYQQIFEWVVRELVNAMYDSELFKDTPYMSYREVNPLFIIIHLLVVMYGGALLKLFELRSIIDQTSSDQNVLLLETIISHDTMLPIVEYDDSIDLFYREYITQLTPAISAMKKNVKDRFSLKEYGRNITRKMYYGLQNQMQIQGKGSHAEICLMWNCGAVPQLRVHARRMFPCSRVRIEYCNDMGVIQNKQLSPMVRDILHRITQRLVSRNNMCKDEHIWHTLTARMGERYAIGLNALERVDTRKWTRKKSEEKIVLTRNATKPFYRAALYQKYQEGYNVISQEYSDHFCTGSVLDMVNLYRSAPIAQMMLYDRMVGGESTREYINAKKTQVMMPKSDVLETVEVISVPHQRESCVQACRLYYVTGNYSAHVRIGPDRELNDLVYWELQRKILKVLAGIAGMRVVLKVHPKMPFHGLCTFQYDYAASLGVEIEKRPLKKIGDSIDIVVADYCSSGLFDSYYAGIPSIYVDFGVKKLTKSFVATKASHLRIVKGSLRGQEWFPELKKEVLFCQSIKTERREVRVNRHYVEDILKVIHNHVSPTSENSL